jgi:hypothetical protein
MFEQIKQVGKTYLTQRYVWWMALFASVIMLPNLLVMLGPKRGTPDGSHPLLFTIGMPMFLLLPLLVGQAKMQFAHSRARLLPRFMPAHVAVLAGIMLLFFVVFPSTLAIAAGFKPLGLLALAVAIGAPALWGAQANRFGPMLLALVVFYSLMTRAGLDWWIVRAADHLAVLGATLVVGAAAVLAWLWRICHMHEEAPDYQNVYALMLARRAGSEAAEQRRIVATQLRRNRLKSQISDWWHERLGGYYGGSRAGLVRVLRYGFGANPVEVQGFFFAALIVTVGIFFSQFSFLAKAGADFGALFLMAQFAILLPGQLGGELMAHRRPRIANEMLLPLSRSQLIDGLFVASAGNAARLWIIINAAMGIVTLTSKEEVSLQTIAMFLLLTATVAFAAFAMSMRTAVWPSMTRRLMVLFCGWLALMTPVILWATMRANWGNAPFIACAVAFVGVGAVLLERARRTWLNLEFA